MIDYLRAKGVPCDAGGAGKINCFNPSHKDDTPSCSVSAERFHCFGCGADGDVFDAAGLLCGVSGRAEQFREVERVLGETSAASAAPEKKRERFAYSPQACMVLDNFLFSHKARRKAAEEYLRKRERDSGAKYPPEVFKKMLGFFGWWPGMDAAKKELPWKRIFGAGVPGDKVGPDGKTVERKSPWTASGVVTKLGAGYKLRYYRDGDGVSCKIGTKSCRTFPTRPVEAADGRIVLIEGEIDELAMRAAGFANAYSTGGTNGLTGPMIKKFIPPDIREIVVLFDNDEEGRRAAGLVPPKPGAGRQTSLPELLRKSGYGGSIKIARIPGEEGEKGYCKDPDEMIRAGRAEELRAVVDGAAEWVPFEYMEKAAFDAGEEYEELEQRRIKVILKKIARESLAPERIQPFVMACLRAFPSGAEEMLREWGATEDELKKKSGASPLYLRYIAALHLSRYLQDQIAVELTPLEERGRTIRVNGIEVPVDFDVLEASADAWRFSQYLGAHDAAVTLAAIFEDRIIYDEYDKRYYIFNGTVWREMSETMGMVYNALHCVLRHFLFRDGDGADDKEKLALKKKYARALKAIDKNAFRVAVLHEFSQSRYICHNSSKAKDPLKFDGAAVRETLSLADGVLDFSGDEIVYRAALPGEYRRHALDYTMEEMRAAVSHDKFDSFMRGNCSNPDTLETLMFYLSMVPSRAIHKYGAFFIGEKNSGKTTTLELLRDIFGGECVQAMNSGILIHSGKVFAAPDGPSPSIAALEGKMLSYSSETTDNGWLVDDLWKKITGGDTISGRRMRQDEVEFVSTAQIIISTNVLPRFNPNDTAIVERMIVIPFTGYHPKDAPGAKEPVDFFRELRPEYPAIIRLFVDYYMRLKKEFHWKIPLSKESAVSKDDYISQSQSDVDRYVADCVVFEIGASAAVSDVYADYLAYYDFDEDSKKNEMMSQQSFSKFIFKNHRGRVSRLVRRDRERENKLRRYFNGMRLKREDEYEEASSAAAPAPEAAKAPPPDERPFG
ncbi:MAG: toprim domain-containing protein [Treponematales bacterium]